MQMNGTGTSAWQGSIWNTGLDIRQDPTSAFEDLQEECYVCFEEVCRGKKRTSTLQRNLLLDNIGGENDVATVLPAAAQMVSSRVVFQPCGHTVCPTCVRRLRSANIYKADLGIKCPFCRTYVESYEGDGTTSARQHSADVARSSTDQSQESGHVQHSDQAKAVRRSPFASKAPYKLPDSHAPEGGVPRRDLLRMNRGELMILAMEPRGQYLMEQQLLVQVDEATVDRTLDHILDAICKQISTLAFHPTGNYILQYIVAAAGSRPPPRRSFGFALKSLKPHIFKCALHQKGNYLAQCLLNYIATCDELEMFLEALKGNWLEVVTNPIGQYVLERIPEAASRLVDQDQERVERLLAGVCTELAPAAKHLLANQIAGNAYLYCISLGSRSPQIEECVYELLRTAGSQIAGSPAGNRALRMLLRMSFPRSGPILLGSLKGSVFRHTVDEYNGGHGVMRHILNDAARDPSSEGARQVAQIVSEELLAEVGTILITDVMLDLLANALSLLDPNETKRHLATLKGILHNPEAFVEAVQTYRNEHQHFNASNSSSAPPSANDLCSDAVPCLASTAPPVPPVQASDPSSTYNVGNSHGAQDATPSNHVPVRVEVGLSTMLPTQNLHRETAQPSVAAPVVPSPIRASLPQTLPYQSHIPPSSPLPQTLNTLLPRHLSLHAQNPVPSSYACVAPRSLRYDHARPSQQEINVGDYDTVNPRPVTDARTQFNVSRQNPLEPVRASGEFHVATADEHVDLDDTDSLVLFALGLS